MSSCLHTLGAECTFILLDPGHPDTEGTGTHGGAMAGGTRGRQRVHAAAAVRSSSCSRHSQRCRLVALPCSTPCPSACPCPAGDVNFFLNDVDEPHTAEVEIMIAEPRRWVLPLLLPCVAPALSQCAVNLQGSILSPAEC